MCESRCAIFWCSTDPHGLHVCLPCRGRTDANTAAVSDCCAGADHDVTATASKRMADLFAHAASQDAGTHDASQDSGAATDSVDVGTDIANASNDISTAAGTGSQEQQYQETHGNRQEHDEDNFNMIADTPAVDNAPNVIIITANRSQGKLRSIVRPVPGWLPTAKVPFTFHMMQCCRKGGKCNFAHLNRLQQ